MLYTPRLLQSRAGTKGPTWADTQASVCERKAEKETFKEAH